MADYFWITLGAAAGASARYMVSRYISRLLSPALPYGTLVINITGSLVLGFFLVWTSERVLADPRWRLIVAVGFCGSYTTFSSYAFESAVLASQRNWPMFAMNVLGNNALCLAAVLAGGALARRL